MSRHFKAVYCHHDDLTVPERCGLATPPLGQDAYARIIPRAVAFEKALLAGPGPDYGRPSKGGGAA